MRVNRGSMPALIALGAVIAFWTVGLLGGLSLLRESGSPTTTLVGLYLMLALAAGSVIVGILAASDLARRLVTPQQGPRRNPWTSR